MPLAYFLTFTTYGTWLHGRDTGSVDREHNEFGTLYLPPDVARESRDRARMRQCEYKLDAERRAVVLRTLREVAAHRGWKLWAVHVRTNHVHMVLSGPARPEKMMADFKVLNGHGERLDTLDGRVAEPEIPPRPSEPQA